MDRLYDLRSTLIGSVEQNIEQEFDIQIELPLALESLGYRARLYGSSRQV
jgi:hypothetical protein